MTRPMAGFHGKLPGVGDFVQRRVPGDFVEPWDRHWQMRLAAMADRDGDDWRQRFLAIPATRFALASHVCGPRAWVGVVAPSRDRAGRVYPLVIAASLPSAADGWPPLPGGMWFRMAEDALRDAVGDVGPEAFDVAVSSLPEPSPTSGAWDTPRPDAARALGWRGDDPGAGVFTHGLPDFNEESIA
ncbi:type VI secretion system-associated protein TagF [Luteibacter sp. 3190]|uniref:type VI secretion system-associated protein TagF n=1 Tax=Luteibacter sp. 3190 TaxID=2817736 RepID=UPI0028587ECF|nr:type VI secretion system-associated protein TagF [Luteibacter sp. 3190]MDR6934908.1 type VI secretion system protein ImpM [Luteibacter sp. 3190]